MNLVLFVGPPNCGRLIVKEEILRSKDFEFINDKCNARFGSLLSD